MTVAFIDTETTGLHADQHEIWDVGVIVDDREYQWMLPVDLSRADPIALEIGHFHERHPQGNRYLEDGVKRVWHPVTVCRELVRLTDGRHLVGAIPSFDEERLRRLFWRAGFGKDGAHEYGSGVGGFSPTWHYHLIDVEALAVGYLRGLDNPDARSALVSPPWKSEDLSLSLNVVPPTADERHTAIGDARWAKRMYEAVMGTP